MQTVIWSATFLTSLSYLFYQLLSQARERLGSKGQARKRTLKWISNSKVFDKKLDEWFDKKNKKAWSTIQYTEELLKKSRLRLGGLPLNKYIFFIEMALLSIMIGIYAWVQLNNPVAGLLIMIVAGYLHYHLLAWDAHYRKRLIRKQTPNFFLTLLNFYEVHSDIILALRETTERIKNPIKTDMLYLLVQLQNGDQTLREAVLEAKGKLDNKLLQDFLDDLELQIRYGGNFASTIQNYINDTIEKEIRIMERSSETAGAAMVTYLLFGVFTMIAVSLNKMQPEMMHLFVTHYIGKIAVVIIIVIMLIVLYVTKELTQVEEE